MSPVFYPPAASGGGGGGMPIGATASIVPAIATNGWIGTHEGVGSGNFITPTINVLYVIPLWIPAAVSVDQIGIAVTAAASAGGVVRLGIYNSKTNGLPGTCLLDAGTVIATSTGVQKVTGLSQSLTAATLYYLGAVAQVAVGTLRSEGVVGASRFGRDPYDPQFFDGTAAVNFNALSVTGVSGALPDLTSASLVGVGDGIRVGLRKA